jgi:peptidoglycan/xylan/chitin deacetylase (PgdA/CDA1 family)
MNHKVLSRAGSSTIAGEILPLSRLMEEKYGYTVKYFRPPHGRYSFRLRNFLKEHNLQNIMWSLLTYDYRNDINIVRKSLNYLRSDSIVVLHDSIKSSGVISDSITLTMDKIASKGFTTGTPDECLK